MMKSIFSRQGEMYLCSVSNQTVVRHKTNNLTAITMSIIFDLQNSWNQANDEWIFYTETKSGNGANRQTNFGVVVQVPKYKQSSKSNLTLNNFVSWEPCTYPNVGENREFNNFCLVFFISSIIAHLKIQLLEHLKTLVFPRWTWSGNRTWSGTGSRNGTTSGGCRGG